ncbi:MAG: PTS sugar transporter subunit IIA [Erysipelotrichaceae bacterium]|nr:PTS sugar transporter subunit IIA [Erysipelotrichaceae bacterium]
MVGILLVSHGMMAEGMMDSISMFFGKNIPQLDYMRLYMDSSADEFGIEMAKKVAELDTGDGVIIFADLFGGTPCNQALRLVSDRVHLIAGMNLPMIMEFLGTREFSELNAAGLVASGQAAIIDAGAMFLSGSDAEEVDDD